MLSTIMEELREGEEQRLTSSWQRSRRKQDDGLEGLNLERGSGNRESKRHVVEKCIRTEELTGSGAEGGNSVQDILFLFCLFNN